MHSSEGSKETLRELLIKANSCLIEFSSSDDYELREKMDGWQAQIETDDYARSQLNSNYYLEESSTANSSGGSKETFRDLLIKANRGLLPFSNSDDYKLRAEMLALEAQFASEDYARSQRNSDPYIEESFATKSSEDRKETIRESLIKANRGLIPFSSTDDFKLRASMLALEFQLTSEDYTRSQRNSNHYLESSAMKSSEGSEETMRESLIKANRGLIPFSSIDDYKLRARMLALEFQLTNEDYARSQRNSYPCLEERVTTNSSVGSKETFRALLMKANRGLLPFSNSDDYKLRARMLALEAELASKDYAPFQRNSISYINKSSATKSSEGSKETMREWLIKANRGLNPFLPTDDYKLRARMLALEFQLTSEDYARSQRNSNPYLEESSAMKSSEGSKETILESLIKSNRGLIPFSNTDDYRLRARKLALEAQLARDDYARRSQPNSY